MTAEMELNAPMSEMASCCQNMDASTKDTCTLCQKEICGNCLVVINDAPVCSTCHEQFQAKLQAEKVTPLNVPIAVVGGLIGSVIGAIIWAAIGIVTGYSIGYVAIGVGWLAGMGAFVASGQKRGMSIQVIGVLSSLFGLLLGKVIMVDFFLVRSLHAEGIDMGYFDSDVFQYMLENPGSFFVGHDILWTILAFIAAWGVAAEREVSVKKSG